MTATTMNVLHLIKRQEQKQKRQKEAQMVNVRIAKCCV
jgi:hypothetical protein